ncbi:hypothetical protein [Massilia endophytica]|uniref:hypothetical protein n=1 Tax=Massilia endophytica TaxID=2899220 RepID=UPI001E3C6CFA|nr:hypothetical protein [Massilia endophytica]UGQ49026.1 hypothetical protein LSQ66_11350 [Massilia endophytica]
MKILTALLLSLPLLAHADGAAFRRELIQGNVKAALQAPVEGKDAVAAQCMKARFAQPPEQTAGPEGPILNAYRRYWHSLLLGQAGKTEAEAALLGDLRRLVPGEWKDLDAASEAARATLERQGLHALAGVTHPYYELMVWRSNTSQEYAVQLPERAAQVKVVMMDGFISRGWLSYASCERFGAGGWTANGTLYALAERYDTASDKFRISYLAHEGQHFADNEDYPALEQPELEYRAKLTELVLSPNPQTLFEHFSQTAQAGRKAPHSHAEYWLVQRLRGHAGGPGLGAAARALLAESSDQARKAGAATVKRFLPD